MSLDLMELAMDIEEEFGVTFIGPELPLGTVGAVYQYILGWRQMALDGVCLSGAIFYRARRALCRQLGLDRRRVCPESRLDELIPLEDRRWHWERFREEFAPLALPDLQRARWLRYTLTAGWVGPLLVAILTFLLLHDPPMRAISWLMSVFLCSLHLVWLTRPLAVCIPAGCGTMREMIHQGLGGDRDHAHAALRRLSEQDVWHRLCQVIQKQLDVDPDRITPETDFGDLAQ